MSTSLSSARPRHVPGLALLRGLAALSVGLYHLTGAVLPKLHVNEVFALFKNGWLGVDVFFVISGFVIPYSLLGKGYTLQKFWPYMSKRIVRINPPAYVAMLLVVIQWYLIDYFIARRIVYTKDVSLPQIINNVFFTVPFSEYKWVVGIFWTLAIEFQFYIIIGILFNLLFERKSLVWFAGLFLVAGLVQYLPFRHVENFFHFSALFALGGVTLYRQRNDVNGGLYVGLLLLFTIIAYLEIGLYEAFTGLATALAIKYVKFENSITKFLGNISYSFYLIHALVAGTCEFILVKFVPVGVIVNRIILQLLILGISIVSSYIFYLIIERPFVRLASRMKV